MPKVFDDDAVLALPAPGRALRRGLQSVDGRERFLLDVYRGQLRLDKCSYQERVETSIILIRLDVGGRPHTNPDGTGIPGPHLHEYREGYDDRFARPAPPELSAALGDLGTTLEGFLTHCNVQNPPGIQRGLF